MSRPPILVLTLLLAAAPAAAFAQARPATVIAGAPQMAARTPALVVIRENTRLPRRQVEISPNQAAPTLRLTSTEAEAAPFVEIRAKDEWFADEGLQVRGPKVAFKRRF